MRVELVRPGAGELTYEIRNIVNVAEKLQKHGVKINWENIGDPIVKGEVIPGWMKEIVAKAAEHLGGERGRSTWERSEHIWLDRIFHLMDEDPLADPPP